MSRADVTAADAVEGNAFDLREALAALFRHIRPALLILIAAMVVGLAVPLGLFGGLAVLLLMVAVTLAIAITPAPRAPTEQKLRQVDIKALPAQTERWLEAQRPALPPPARTLIDQIGAVD